MKSWPAWITGAAGKQGKSGHWGKKLRPQSLKKLPAKRQQKKRELLGIPKAGKWPVRNPITPYGRGMRTWRGTYPGIFRKGYPELIYPCQNWQTGYGKPFYRKICCKKIRRRKISRTGIYCRGKA
jgi:hypothetical protein